MAWALDTLRPPRTTSWDAHSSSVSDPVAPPQEGHARLTRWYLPLQLFKFKVVQRPEPQTSSPGLSESHLRDLRHLGYVTLPNSETGIVR